MLWIESILEDAGFNPDNNVRHSWVRVLDNGICIHVFVNNTDRTSEAVSKVNIFTTYGTQIPSEEQDIAVTVDRATAKAFALILQSFTQAF